MFLSCIPILACWWVYGWLRDRRNGDPSARFSARKASVGLLWLILCFGIGWHNKPTRCTAYSMGWTSANVSYCATQADLLSAGLISKETYDRRISAASLESDMAAARTKRYQQGEPEPPPATAPSATAPTSGPEDANDPGRP